MSFEDAEGNKVSPTESEEPVVACPAGGIAQALQERHSVTEDLA